MKFYLTFFLFTFGFIAAKAQDLGSMTDPRDGQTYATVTIPIILSAEEVLERKWTAVNMNYNSSNSSCYENVPEYCPNYGRYYTLADVKTICPKGWHPATVTEWNEVIDNYRGPKYAGRELLKGGISGLNVLKGGCGFRNEEYKNMGLSAYQMAIDSTEGGSQLIVFMDDAENDIQILTAPLEAENNYNCRCVKDY